VDIASNRAGIDEGFDVFGAIADRPTDLDIFQGRVTMGAAPDTQRVNGDAQEGRNFNGGE